MLIACNVGQGGAHPHALRFAVWPPIIERPNRHRKGDCLTCA